ncbi:hypothetical protein QYF36_026598 [Acer negundo]|nr:hypothetical protein QYF36_026598 [Acer negundo]
MEKNFSYALSMSLEELDTNVTTFPQSSYQCQTLRTLKQGPCSSDLPDLSSLTLLTTMELTDVWLPNCDFFPRCLVLKNLSIIDCQSLTTLKISAPRLVRLIISNYRSFKKNRNGKFVRTAPNDGKIVIAAHRLKFFNLKELDPLVLRIFHVKSLRISLNFVKEKFIMCCNNVDEETKIVVLNKEIREEQLVGLATILEEI